MVKVMVSKCIHQRNFCVECHGKSEIQAPSPQVSQALDFKPEPAAWRMFDGEGNYTYTDDQETAEDWKKYLGGAYASWLEELFKHHDAPAVERMRNQLENLQESCLLDLRKNRELSARLAKAEDLIKALLSRETDELRPKAEAYFDAFNQGLAGASTIGSPVPSVGGKTTK